MGKKWLEEKVKPEHFYIRFDEEWSHGKQQKTKRAWGKGSESGKWWKPFFIFLSFYFILFCICLFYFTILYWFCHTSAWICHRCTWVPSPEPPSHLPPHTISLGHPSAPAPSILYPGKLVQPLWRTVWRFLKKLEIELPYDPAIPLLGIHTEETRIDSIFSYTSGSWYFMLSGASAGIVI